ncbi:TPA: hypothetical protein I9Y90_003319 [Elizabethkingia anophelis]|nr:hypothetical protein [Elizabethkingia anophelis]HAT4012974.1 hypothetical protein [Elizabethkingia anophelis]
MNFEDNVKTFTTAIITLVSMNLFVTNLLLTHLKDERDDLQSIIDKRLNFKFITYLGFTIVINILVLYFISPTISNQELKSNVLIFIFSTFIIYIFFLITLYNKVFDFIHKLKRSEIIKSELEYEFLKAFYNNFLKKEFKSRYENLMEKKLGFSEYGFFNDKELKAIYTPQKKDKYLKDINIKKLEKKLNRIEDMEKFYEPLELGQKLNKGQDYFFILFSQKYDKKLLDCYCLSSKSSLNEYSDNENLDRLLKKINNNTLINKHAELKDNLKSLDEIYSKYTNIN